MDTRTELYINGMWVESTAEETIDVVNPATEEIIGRVPNANAEDVDRAVWASYAAFPAWSATPLEERIGWLTKLKEGIEARSEEFAVLVTREMGVPLELCRNINVANAIRSIDGIIEDLQAFDFSEELGNSLIEYEPIGVAACITPWNFPLVQVIRKAATAMGTGNTVVVKPSEQTPLDAYLVAEVFHEIGLPPGVFNLVTGYGVPTGEALVSHPEVSMITLTGSTVAGKRVMALAADGVKKVALELGGKTANVILDDADLKQAVEVGLGSCYFNSGQVCVAQSRMLVPRENLEEATAIAKEVAESYSCGDPMESSGKLGPLVSERQHDRVRDYIRKGIEEGATLVTGGEKLPDGIDSGYYVRPTVFSDVSNDMTIAREEIFGPVLSIIPYEDEEDAVRIANDTPYGLAGAVWSGDMERAKKVGRQIQAGKITINGAAWNRSAPFGGYKQSGIGREGGRHGIHEFLEVKCMDL